MNAFQSCRSVEARAFVRLLPFIEEHADGGHYVRTDKGRLARFLQETVGDVLFNKRGFLLGVELKAEEKYTGNLFLEVWSNRNLEDPDSHAMRGSNPGWLLKTTSDLIFYYFLDADKLYILSTLALKRWAFGYNGKSGNLYAIDERCEPCYREVRQSKHSQLNDTWGRVVPVSALVNEMKPAPKMTSIRQLELLPEVIK